MAIILLLMFIGQFSPASNVKADDAAMTEPRVEWSSDENAPDMLLIRDTDGDGIDELVFWDSSKVWVIDPPTYACKLKLENLSGLGQPEILDVDADGIVEIVLHTRPASNSSSYDPRGQYSIFSGNDFSLEWESPIWRFPVMETWESGGWAQDFHMLVDVDRDGVQEFVWFMNGSTDGEPTVRVCVYDGKSHALEWTSPMFNRSIDILFYNVDPDPSLELILYMNLFNYEALWALNETAIQVYDGSTFELQWEIPGKAGKSAKQLFYGSGLPSKERLAAEGGLKFEIRVVDVTDDGIRDIVLEYEQVLDPYKMPTEIRVYAGSNGDLVWNATLYGDYFDTLPYYINYHRHILDIGDLDGDGKKEILAVSCTNNVTGANDTDIRIYSGATGNLEWNLTVTGIIPPIDVSDINSDGSPDLLIAGGIEKNDSTYDRQYMIWDINKNNTIWETGPIPGSGYSFLYGDDIDSNGIEELIINNITQILYTNEEGERVQKNTVRTFQILDPTDHSVLWSSPASTADSWENLEVIKGEASTMPVIVIHNGSFTEGSRFPANNTVSLFSAVDYHRIWTSPLSEAPYSLYPRDAVNDPADELVVEVGSNDDRIGAIYVFDMKTSALLWNATGFDFYSVTGGDFTGDPGKELLYCSRFYNHSAPRGGASYSKISILDSNGFAPLWDSGFSVHLEGVMATRDFDKDGNDEILLMSSFNDVPRLGIIELPKGQSWADGLDWPALGDPPPVIDKFNRYDPEPQNDPRTVEIRVYAQDADRDNLTYNWSENGVPLGSNQSLIWTFPYGKHTVWVQVSDDNSITAREFNFTIRPALGMSVPATPPVPPVLVATGGFIAVMLVGLFYGATSEAGKYRLSAFFLPLYTRFRKEELLDNMTRGTILGFIHADPGIHLNELLRRLELGTGTAIHHLMMLEREGYIKSRTDGRLRRFYPAGMRLADIPPRLEAVQKVILDTLQNNDGLSQREIARVLDISYSAVNRHVKKLAAEGLLRLERKGTTVRCYIIENLE